MDGIHDICTRLLLEVLGIDLHQGCRGIGDGTCTVTDHDHLVEELIVGDHLDGELSSSCDLLGLVADVGDDNGGTLIDGQREVTIHVCGSTIGRHTLLADRGADDRLTSLVEDGTLDGQLLSKGATDR